MNQYDLQYLTNPNFMNMLGDKEEHRKLLSAADKQFYKKRIFQKTKEFLKSPDDHSDLYKVFETYAAQCVKHFKFIDKAETIQLDYTNIKQPKKSKIDKDSLKKGNHIIMKKKQIPAPRITDHIKITSTRVKTSKKMIIPKQRKINLQSDKFKNKK